MTGIKEIDDITECKFCESNKIKTIIGDSMNAQFGSKNKIITLNFECETRAFILYDGNVDITWQNRCQKV